MMSKKEMQYKIEQRQERIEEIRERIKKETSEDARRDYKKRLKGTDVYYQVFIQDVIKNLREGGVDYLYKLSQVEEIMKTYPDVVVIYALQPVECYIVYLREEELEKIEENKKKKKVKE